jgi:hypothetical protein
MQQSAAPGALVGCRPERNRFSKRSAWLLCLERDSVPGRRAG